VEGVSAAIVKQQDSAKQERYIDQQMQIIDYWQMLNDEANVYGTMVHDSRKIFITDKWYFPPDTEEGKFEQK
jgi:hypothetical protein